MSSSLKNKLLTHARDIKINGKEAAVPIRPIPTSTHQSIRKIRGPSAVDAAHTLARHGNAAPQDF